MRKPNHARLVVRLALFIGAAVFHLLVLLFFAVTANTAAPPSEQAVPVMKLADFEEEVPPPEPPPLVQETADALVPAEIMIETAEPPAAAPDAQAADPGAQILSPGPPAPPAAGEEETYLPMHKISVPPVFSERDILSALVYPRIALHSDIEGTVYLELFVNRRGEVTQIKVLREIPPDRGFGEAAANAFRGIRGTPAEANGVPVGVRYRYPVRFTIKG